MTVFLSEFNPTHIVYVGAIGLFLGFLFFLFFVYRRIRWMIRALLREKIPSPGLLSSIGRLLMISLWTSIFGMVLFLGFFLRTYHAFTYEEPIAEIRVQEWGRPETGQRAFMAFSSPHTQSPRNLLIRGDQWMIEGDLLKWENWLNFLGLENRYRITRLRGRYLNAESEAKEPPTIHSLTSHERDPFWEFLYKWGPRLPFIATVYGCAAFQYLKNESGYLIYMGQSGFIVREK